MSDRVPVLVITGAPGSGKTSLLARWLADPEFSDSALLVNEFGEVAIDQHLVRGHTGCARAVCGRCICCTGGAAFAAVLESLAVERTQRRIARFGRLIVETHGLAQPAAIVERLESEALLRANYRYEGMVTAVDAVEGLRSFEAHPETVSQVARADALVITKTDIADPAEVDRVEARLGELNRHAHVIRSVDGNALAQLIVAAVQEAPTRISLERHEPATGPEAWAHGQTQAFTLRPDRAFDAEVLRSRLEAFVDRHGARILRMKGLVAIDSRPGPVVVQAVAGHLYPVRLMTRWPEGAHSGLVILAHGLAPAEAMSALGEAALTHLQP